MNGVVRRRMSSADNGDYIENPDCLYIELTTSSDNTTYNIGMYINGKITYLEIDGNPTNPTFDQSKLVLNFEKAGNHVVLIRFSNLSGASNLLINNVPCTYVRYPYNFKSKIPSQHSIISNATYINCLDILDPNYVQLTANLYITGPNVNTIRVPIGSKSKYNGNLNASLYNRIVEFDFKYRV